VGNKVQNKDNHILAGEIKEKLDWYITHTPEEDYDEKVVDSFLELLDNLEPLEEQIPRADDAWGRFQEMVRQRETRAAGEEIVGQRAALGAGEEAVRQREVLEAGKESVRRREVLEAGKESVRRREALEAGKESVRRREALDVKEEGKSKRNKDRDLEEGSVSHGGRKLGNILVRQKYIAAAVLLALILGVVGATQTMASPDTGFFHWLRRDAAGTEMVTSPENLDGSMGAREHVYYNRSDVPDWADEWLEIEEDFQMPKGYEWERYEVNVFDYTQYMVGFYCSESSGEEILIGMILYKDQISHNSENFLGYSYMENYEAEEKEMEIYCRVEEAGNIYYTICFQEGNCQYFIRGQDDLEELKELAERYYDCVKNNL